MYQPPIIPPLTGIYRGLQENAVETRSNEFHDDSAFTEISLKEYESHIRGEFCMVHDTGFWDTNNLNDGVSLATAMKHEDKLVADDGIKDLGNNVKSGGSLTVENGMENVENEANRKDDSTMTYETSLAADNIVEDRANNLEDETETDNSEEDTSGMNEANLAVDNSEDESSNVSETGTDDEAQRTALSLRSSMVI
ncbi:uncharacterized protein LOC117122350, partial [Anneissia japonica]|uniref:uncharacterized protein LOC117122350 n=1 Tax=Anneissia japonica TaxID=1529436 RepID=UPI0014255FD9